MQYIYVGIFAFLISPVQTWLGVISGFYLGQWERFSAELATGALFAYAALLGMEALLRLELLPNVVRETQPELVKKFVVSGWVLIFFALLSLCVLWVGNSESLPIPRGVHALAILMCLFALGLSFFLIKIETAAKEAVEETTLVMPAT